MYPCWFRLTNRTNLRQSAADRRMATEMNRKNLSFAGFCWSHPSESNRRPADYESAALPTELGWRGDALAGINEGQGKVNRVASALSCGARQRLARCPGGCMLAMAATGVGAFADSYSPLRASLC